MTEHQIQDIARVCHEANRAYCETLRDHSQQPWDKAPAWQRESAITGVVFHLAHPDVPASASHDSWLKVKTETGWQYGPYKDETKKEHPCIVPFDQLPYAQQIKDYIFQGIVHAFVKADAEKDLREGR